MEESIESIAILSRRWARPFLRVVEVVLVILLGLVLARLAWLIIEPGGAVSLNIPTHISSAQPGAPARSVDVDTTRLTRENPFGSDPVTMAEIPDAPETSLNLRLRGLRASTEENDGVALITGPDNRTAAYGPGDDILDGVILHKIYGDRVTLRKGGQIEALLMEGGAGLLSVLTVPGQDKPTSSIDESAPRLVARTDLMSNITIDPVHSGGSFVGFRIGARGDADALTRAGLQPGDVVVGLDGNAITDVAPAELARKFSDPQPVRLRIDRQGKVFEHTLAPEEAR